MSAVRGPEQDTQLGETIILKVPNKGPYGILLESDRDGQGLIIKSWERLPDGKFSQIQRHGGVHLGDAIMYVNEVNLSNMAFKQAAAVLTDPKILKKELKFVSPEVYYHRKKTGGTSAKETRGEFVSIVRRVRLNEEDGPRKFTQFEIACQLRAGIGRVQKEKIFKWSIWRRYSDFQNLHTKMSKTYGWQMENIAFPPSYALTFDKFSDEFVNRRKDELVTYWQQITSLPQVTDFTKHHCSEELKEFLEVDEIMRADSGTDVMSDEDGGEGGNVEGNGGVAKRNSVKRTQSVRRRASTKMSGGGGASAGFDEADVSSGPVTAAPPPSSRRASDTAVNSNNNDSSSNNESSSSAKPAAPQPTVDPRFASYSTMRKVLPEMALRHKLLADGFTDAEIDAYFAATDPERATTSSSTLSSVASTPAASRPASVTTSKPSSVAASTSAPPPEAAKAIESGKVPPKASGARGNLLAAINAKRIE